MKLLSYTTFGKHCFPLIICIFQVFESSAQIVRQETVTTFVKLNAFETEEDDIISEIVFFVNNRYSAKKGIQWNDGSIITHKGNRYEDLKLKFNMIDNSLFIKIDDDIYRFSNEAVVSFSMMVRGDQRVFQRGYHTLDQHILTGEFRVSGTEMLAQISSFPGISNVEIRSVDLKKQRDTGKFSIVMTLYGLDILYDFQSHLRNHVDIYNVKISSDLQSFSEELYLEHLLSGDNFELIRHNSKELSQGGSVSLIKSGELPVFDDLTYYIADKGKNIYEISFSKKSVSKALSNCGYQNLGNLGPVSGEKKMIQSLNRLKKDP